MEHCPPDDKGASTMEHGPIRPDTLGSSGVHAPSLPLRTLVGGHTKDDPICIDSSEEDEGDSRNMPDSIAELVGQSLNQPSRLTQSAPAGAMGAPAASHAPISTRKRLRPRKVPSSRPSDASFRTPVVAADRDSESDSDSNDCGLSRSQVTKTKITFPVANKHNYIVSSTRDSQNGSVTFHVLENSDSEDADQVEIIDIVDDDSDGEVPEEAFSPTPKSRGQQVVEPAHDQLVEAIDPSTRPSSHVPQPADSDKQRADTGKRGDEDVSVGVVPSNTNERNQYSDDETSSPDDSTESSGLVSDTARAQQPQELAAPPIQVAFGSSQQHRPVLQPFEQHMNEHLQPPPLRRSMGPDNPFTPEEYKVILSHSQKQSEWIQSLRSNHFLKEWNSMARRLREWQLNGGDSILGDDETVNADLQSNVLTGTLHPGTREHTDFQGGVDPPISSKQRLHELGAMNFVPMYDKQYVDESTGLPCRQFTVIGSPDNIIYSFVLQVRLSSIPNAGYGLFVKFLGAKELKPSIEKRAEEIQKTRQPKSNILFDKLSTFHPHGFGMNVTLTGENLKAPYNSMFSHRNLKMTIHDDRVQVRKKTTRTITLKFANPDILYDDDELEGLRNPNQRIGHYGLYKEEDFVEAPKRTFSSLHWNCGFIDIGRYGPFRKEDRKIELNFDIKNFLFSFEPGMWSFGVPEKILGREQVIDITDDITGEPHEDARKNLTMYVNEVGHNQSLHETIHALDEDDRTIKYFLMIDNCLKKGDEMEVFVNYKERYEENRERKCYGAKNLSGETRGDDHLPSRLMRNFVDRREVLGCIQEADVMDLYLLVDFCFELGQNLHRSLHDFLMTVHFGKDNCFVSPITAIQITAIRRLDWLVTALEDRSNDLQKKLAPSESQAAFYLLKQSHFFLSQMRWGRWTELFAFLEKYPTLLDKHKKNLSTALEQEGVEEICFEVSEKLAMPLDESRWCSVAIELTHALCTATAKAVWQNLDRRALAVNFVVAAAKAAQEIKNPRDLSRLAFNLRFQDPFVSCPESEIIGAIKIKTETVTKVVVTKNASWNVGDNQAEATDMLMGYKTAMDVAANQMDMIQTTWYLARQVYFVVSVISQVALNDEPSFSPHHLLHILGIDTLVGQAAVKCDVVPQESTLVAPKSERIRKQIQRTQKKESCKALKKKAAPKERVNNNLFWQIVWSTLKDEHGWQLEHGNRPNDFYALPPGVARGKGFRNRVDFFDSVPLIVDYLKTNPKWSENPGIQKSLQDYYSCKDLYDKLVSKKKMPKFDDRKEKVDWLRVQAKKQDVVL